MTGKLDCPRFVRSDMPRIRSHNTLIRLQQQIEYCLIGLRSAHKKEDSRVLAGTGCLDLLRCILTDLIGSVTVKLSDVHFRQAF